MSEHLFVSIVFFYWLRGTGGGARSGAVRTSFRNLGPAWGLWGIRSPRGPAYTAIGTAVAEPSGGVPRQYGGNRRYRAVADVRKGDGVVFNGLDYLIIGVFLAIIGVGFFNGVTKLTAAIIAIYFAALVAAAFYRPLTASITGVVTMNRSTGELVCFTLLFLLFTGVFTIVISRWLGDLRLPRRVAIIDNLGGAALGVVVSGLAMTLAALVLAIMLQALNQTVDVRSGGPGLGVLRDELRHSALVPFFLRMSPFFLRVLTPWFPGDPPPILEAVA